MKNYVTLYTTIGRYPMTHTGTLSRKTQFKDTLRARFQDRFGDI